MQHTCTRQTDPGELIGNECRDGQQLKFRDGPLVQVMKDGEELALENSKVISVFMRAKLNLVLGGPLIDATSN